MANLKDNGTEVARYRRENNYGGYYKIVHEISVRSNGRIMKRTKQLDSRWTGWIYWINVEQLYKHPDAWADFCEVNKYREVI